MNNCLVTKLKAVVNNPNLPVLKTDIDDFTKAAILASGNDSMTEAQKWALDTYFDSIGALNNSGAWTKIKALYIPAILTDRTKIFVNYKDIQATPGYHSRQQLSNGGAYASVQQIVDASTGIMMNGADCSFYLSCDRNILSVSNWTAPGEVFKCPDGNNTNIAGISFGTTTGKIQLNIHENGYTAGTGFRKSYTEETLDLGSEYLVTRTGTDSPVCGFVLRDMNNVDKTDGFEQFTVADRPATDESISTTVRVSLKTDANVKYNIIAVGQALTAEEAETVVEAGIELKKAFISANSGS